ncbi:Calcineurin-like phosphoesterase superfamily domain protein [Roseovarius sp. THAF9]|uniref:metallophosphoesterase family protein n=1 Tax=Roseovarius sp. THAF9 TaxID=2587847 RepID=UPI00126981D6|nr:metallophosphoesterase family protein [Roseovarius sp. THAF9]QFT93175.1 Calcineurin-like phosphoesterase superfamily domain protein [Roseovarius sp. THAF9]
MKLVDLGTRDTPLAVFGGPYSNRHATQALLARTARLGISPRDTICTGDLVAYCGAPAQTVALIRSAGLPVVAGNCEKQLAAYQMDCGCGFEDGSTCDLLSAGWYAHADAAIGADDRAWMDGLPDMIRFTHHGLRCAVIHGGLSDISRFLWSSSPAPAFASEIALIEAQGGPVDIVFAGHSGIAFRRRIGQVLWVNAGVIGMPPNDGTPRTEYALLRDGAVSLHKLDYDCAAARADMQAAGLIQGYDAALATGYWPSEDVLPAALRRSS